MFVGMLTTQVREQSLETLIPWAASQGITGLEVDVSPGSHLDAATVDDATIAQIQELLAAHNVRITSLGSYGQLVGVPDERAQQAATTLRNAIALAPRLGVDTICTLAGFPVAGKDRARTIMDDLPDAFRPFLDQAGEQGVRIALENWFATNIQHLDHWRSVFEVLPDDHFGLNFDPSHLDWQGIDVSAAVHEFRDRIFHVHAKDVAVNETRLRRVGYQGNGWWRYVLPGYGRIRWGEFIGTLRQVGYNGVLSIEHEDDAFPHHEGFTKAARYLNALI
jgi:sugar phosphate isomerase/epimerase